MESNLQKTNFDELTKQELLVVASIARGLKNEEIADSMNISINTVKTYLARVYRKCGVRNRVELTIWFIEKNKNVYI